MLYWIWRVAREPMNALTHGLGFILALVVFVFLLKCGLDTGSVRHIVALSIFGISLILLYFASTLFHLLPLQPPGVARLQRFDQMMVFVLIAGTYTPVCIIALAHSNGWLYLGVVWACAAIGIGLNIVVADVPEWLSIGLCIPMGALALLVLPTLVAAIPLEGIIWLAIGGAVYVIGALIMGFDRPHLVPGRFDAHALWHICVLVGSACHIWAIVHTITPIR